MVIEVSRVLFRTLAKQSYSLERKLI